MAKDKDNGAAIKDDPLASTVGTSPGKPSTGKKKRNKKQGKKKSIPAEGDPDYLTPTQLRNRRKRRAKQQNSSNPSKATDTVITNKSSDGGGLKDPSMKYIANPKNAPIVQTAKKYFQSIQTKHTDLNDFRVHLGPLYNWRTVSKLAVRAADNSNNEKPKAAIGLFLPQSHNLLPVPKCRAHHPSINEVVECVTRACHDVGIEPYQETLSKDNKEGEEDNTSDKGKGQLRYICVNIERKTGGAQLTLVWNGDAPKGKTIDDPDLAKLVKTILSMRNDIDNTDKCKNAAHHVLEQSTFNDVLEEAEQLPAKKKRRRGKRESKCNEEYHVSSTSKDFSKTHSSSSATAKQPKINLHSLWVNYNLSWKHSNAIFAYDSKCWRHVHGPPAIIEHLDFGDEFSNQGSVYAKPPLSSYPIPLHFPPNVFRQANLDAFTNIVGRIRERVTKLGKDLNHASRKKSNALPTCIELYGGVGTIGLHLSDIVSSLVSSDENTNNVKCFNNSVRTFPASVQSRMEYKQKNATDMILTEASLFQKCQVLIVDPPRKGLDDEVVDYLCQNGWRTLNLVVYVSCGFQAFQRDCNSMLDSGHWKLEFAEGYLLFPGSDAIETCAFFVPT